MKVIKRLNNSAVLCVDSRGRQVVAFGKGISFALPKNSDELPLSAIERTFYNVNEHYLALLNEIEPDVLSLSADLADSARNLLPYELSQNLPFVLADHISFALQRHRQGISVAMPLSYDVNQMYPMELRLGRSALERISRDFDIDLPESEAVGVALCLVNAIGSPEGDAASASGAVEDDVLIDELTEVIEGRYGIIVDRHGFEYSRFATHVRYLISRLRSGKSLSNLESGDEMYRSVREHMGRSVECLDRAVAILEERLKGSLNESEKLYLLLHISRVAHERHSSSDGTSSD